MRACWRVFALNGAGVCAKVDVAPNSTAVAAKLTIPRLRRVTNDMTILLKYVVVRYREISKCECELVCLHSGASCECVPSLARTKPGALGLSHHSLGLSCARPIFTRADAELAFERPGEIREIVEADGVGDFLGQCA